MKFAKALLGCSLFLAFLLVGCVHSEKPFYQEKDLVFDPELVGEWCEEKDDSKTNRVTWAFTAGEGKSYELKLSGLDGETAVNMRFHARLFVLEGHRFLDFYATKDEISDVNEKYAWLGFFRPTHSVVRLPKSEKGLVMEVMVPKKAEEYVKKGKAAFDDYDGRIVLTGSTRQSQRMLRESLRGEGWWGDPAAKLVRCVK
jgi:hypothetical protein